MAAVLAARSRHAVALQSHCRSCVSAEIAFRIFGGNHNQKLHKTSNVRKWKVQIDYRNKQFRREHLKELHQKLINDRESSRIPHLQRVHRKRMVNFVELENVRMAAYRKYEDDQKLRELLKKLEDTEVTELEERELTDVERIERIKYFQRAGFVTPDNLDQSIDAALDNPIGFGAPLSRRGIKLLPSEEPRVTTTTSANAASSDTIMNADMAGDDDDDDDDDGDSDEPPRFS